MYGIIELAILYRSLLSNLSLREKQRIYIEEFVKGLEDSSLEYLTREQLKDVSKYFEKESLPYFVLANDLVLSEEILTDNKVYEFITYIVNNQFDNKNTVKM